MSGETKEAAQGSVVETDASTLLDAQGQQPGSTDAHNSFGSVRASEPEAPVPPDGKWYHRPDAAGLLNYDDYGLPCGVLTLCNLDDVAPKLAKKQAEAQAARRDDEETTLGTGKDLRDVCLEDMDLAGLDLGEADLRRAKCQCTNFAGCNLTNARLHDAQGKEANFTNANLKGADFEKAQLEKAIFV